MAGVPSGSGGADGHRNFGEGYRDHIPKMNFPPFDGENPRLWLGRCLDYFEMYFVPRWRWVKITTMHMSAVAANWLQSVEDDVRKGSWDQFCHMIMERFGKDQHALLIRQLFHIHQTHTVQDYIDKFTGLVEQLVAYSRTTDPLYYAMRFVDGLRVDIRNAVHLQRPSTLDTACMLALFQEELVDPARRREVRQLEPFTFAKAPVRGPMPLPPPPPRP
jgi:hypothetical protein